MTNVVLFISDEHNPRYSSVYGHPFIQTPNVERLARQGTVYQNAYCPSPLCVPSRSAFMSGYWPHEIQRYNNCKVIEGRYPGYGQVLADQGVHTAYIGSASNLYRDPRGLGFTELLLATVTQRSLNPNAVRRPGQASPAPKTEAPHGPEADRYQEDVGFVDRAVDWLQRTAPGLDSPWTVTVNVHPPHPPWTADPAYWQMYDGRGDLPPHDVEQPSAQHAYAADLRARSRWDYSPELARDLRQGYYAAVSYVDHELGRVLDAVEAAGLADDTVVCYTTDHGEMLGKFGIWGKCSLYEDSVRVPLVAAGPGFSSDTRVSTPVSTLDLQAALFHAVDAQRPGAWHGQPLQTLPTHDPERAVFAEYHGPGPRAGGFMIRRGDWKLLYNIDAEHQLFDLREDPEELDNRWPHRPDVAAALERELRQVCDPEGVHEGACDFQQRQLDTIESIQQQMDAGSTSLPWEEAASHDRDNQVGP